MALGDLGHLEPVNVGGVLLALSAYIGFVAIWLLGFSIMGDLRR